MVSHGNHPYVYRHYHDCCPESTGAGHTGNMGPPGFVSRAVISPQSATFLMAGSDVPAIRVAIAEIAHAGYTEAAIRERLGLTDITELKWKALPIYRDERLTKRDPQAFAMELFLLQGNVAAADLALLLSAASVDALLRTGILAIDSSGQVRAL